MSNHGIDQRLLGLWASVPGSAERVTMEFNPDGSLVYSIFDGGKVQAMLLTFAVVDDWIETNQPSRPREERTRYRITDQDELELVYESEVTTYLRQS